MLPQKHPYFISSPVFRESGFSGLHPLAISRLAAVEDVCRLLGWLPDSSFLTCQAVDEARLSELHDPDYVKALRVVSATGAVSGTQRTTFNFGTMENPVFSGIFERAATTVGGAILAAEQSLAHGVSFHPGGGTHHGQRARASGFCYFNDPAFAIRRYQELGVGRVAYLDLDAHHGDGVEALYAANENVVLCSIHEEKRWPHTGAGDGTGPANALNLPVPKGFCDDELAFLMDEVILPELGRYRPEAIVVTCGADELVGDPLSGLMISNGALWDAVEKIVSVGVPTTLLGGGGYNPWTTVRAWSGLWGRISEQSLPNTLPAEVTDLFAGFECDLVDEDEADPRWQTHLDDEPSRGEVREQVKSLARRDRRG